MTKMTLKRAVAALGAALATVAVLAPLAASRPSAAAGTQRFTITSLTVHGIDRPTRVTARGPISGSGPVRTPAGAGRVNHLTLELGRGSLSIVAREHSAASHPDLERCIDIETGQGSFTITAGTRTYHSAHGSGTYTRRTTITGARDTAGKCLGQHAQPVSIKTNTQLTGTVSLH